MKCPFLQEAHVKSCRNSPFRKLLVRTPGDTDRELCYSLRYAECPVYRAGAAGPPHDSQCPFLRESLVQFCAASPVTKFVPYSESLLSRCGNDGHRYCDLYHAWAHPGGEGASPAADQEMESWVDGIRVPPGLFYSPNHMWLDPGADGCYHIGIDGFLAYLVGPVENVSLLTLHGVQRPTAVLTVRGVDLTIVFPHPLLITGCNLYLRAQPSRLTSDPYGTGWLFEATAPPASGPAPACPALEGLIEGRRAAGWMRQEVARLAEFAHACAARPDETGESLVADGGVPGPHLAQHLCREEILSVFSQFFSPYVTWSK